ncbi:MAG: hypothetical protein ACREMD_07020 [Gemmatimonadota bacterium]
MVVGARRVTVENLIVRAGSGEGPRTKRVDWLATFTRAIVTSMKAAVHRIPFLALLLAAGCVSAEERQAATTGPISVQVTNHNFLDMNVYAVAGSQTIRLGTVRTNAEQMFEVPPGLPVTGGLRFLVDPIGSSDAYLSDDVLVSPGDIVDLVIQSSLGLSSTVVH